MWNHEALFHRSLNNIQRECETTKLSFIGHPVTFNVSVKPSSDFPVDIYFLVDASFSMKDDLENIRQLGGAIGMTENLSESITFLAEEYLEP